MPHRTDVPPLGSLHPAIQYVKTIHCISTKVSTQKMYKYSLYNSTGLIKPNP